MMAPAAQRLGVHLRALVEAPDGATAQVVVDSIVGGAKDAADLRRLTDGADALTFEHEHVDNDQMRGLREQGVSVQPPPEALLYAQDKIQMRTRLTALGVPCPRWRALSADARTAEAELVQFLAESADGSAVVKTARGGYDGKGVRVVNAPAEVADWIGGQTPLLVEERVDFVRELAVLVARRPSGQAVTYPVVESIQRGGVCAEVIAPAPDLDPAVATRAREIALSIAQGLGVTGIVAVEMFETSDRGGAGVLVNELAMRPHNSGHWTIDGAQTSQFEQHIRAVLDLPLGPTGLRAPVTVMANILGSTRASLSDALPEALAAVPGARVELYGKEIRPGRKLGHVNVCGDDPGAVAALARTAAEIIMGS
ncbi:5-(carboxyamino)imidazole ribonucleotide synthase [Rarobacter incanus]